MTIIPDLTDLMLSPVLDRGVANREMIAIRVNVDCSMGKYAVLVGRRQSDGAVMPILDHFYYFGEGSVPQGDWIFLYTGAGEPYKTRSKADDCNIYCIYWNKPNTLFADTAVTPLLIQIGGLVTAPPVVDQPQTWAIRKQSAVKGAIEG